MKKERSSKDRKKILAWVLGGLVAVAIVLVIAIVVVANNSNPNIEETDAATRAAQLTESIDEKLASNPDYNPPQAFEEYAKVYGEAEGSYKVYVAVEFAKYLCDTLSQCDLALAVVNGANVGDSWNEQVAYFGELIELYKILGDEDRMHYYEEILDALANGGESYEMEREG